MKAPCSPVAGLLADTQLLNDSAVAADIAMLQVIEHPAALTYQFQQTQTGAVVLLIHLKVLGEVRDAVREQRNLRLGRPCVGARFLKAVFFEDGLLGLGRENHRLIGVTPSLD